MDKYKAVTLAAAAAIAFTSAGCQKKNAESPETQPSGGTMRDISTMELVHDMGIGINLGNTFESCGGWINGTSVTDYETAWGSPVITKEIIKGYADSGFGVLRVPVAWSNMMDSEYNIDPQYISRVKEVVRWAVEDDMYVIMNIHWDGGWFDDFPSDKEKCMTKYKAIWGQLCDNFGEFDDHLMFESLNEEGGWSELWDRYSGTTEGKAESYELLNEINQEFVDLVRSSGGNNSERHLLIAGYVTDIDCTCDEMYKMPEDPKGRCAVSVHYYTPSTFCLLAKPTDWGSPRETWGSPRDMNELENYMELLKTTFIDKGIPVIMGEYGAVAISNKTPEQIRNYNTAVCTAAYKRGICPVLWDITGVFYDRDTCQFKDRDMLEGMMAVKE